MAEFSTFPCGDLEKFVLSSNRRKLLQIEREDETKQDPDAPTPISSLLYGSNEHTKYYLQVIENEITSILLKYNNDNNLDNISENDQNTIKSLLTEANTIINKYKKNKSQSNDVSILNFRHKLRTLFLSPYIQLNDENETPGNDDSGDDNKDEKEEDIYDILINKLGVRFNYSKPSDIAVGGDNNDENEQKISHTMPVFDIQNEINNIFNECKDKGDIKRRFNKGAIPLVLKQDFNTCVNGILDLCNYSKNVLAIENRVDLAIMLLENNTSISFDNICNYFNFTRPQLDELAQKINKAWR
eukprot:124044_1